MQQKYGDIKKLNDAWKSSYVSFSEIKPSQQQDLSSDKAYLDIVEWYKKSMTDYADWWISTTCKYYPDTLVYLCTGGLDTPLAGANFFDQCKSAAKHGAGVRITNEANDYARNFCLTNWVGSPSRFYGAKFGYEPAGPLNSQGNVNRVFNTITQGATHVHYYWPNLTMMDELHIWPKYAPLLKKTVPVCPVGAYYPDTEIPLRADGIEGFVYNMGVMRDYFNYDYVNETMITDNALEKYKVLVMFNNEMIPDETVSKICSWVTDKNGVVITNNNKIVKLIETATASVQQKTQIKGKVSGWKINTGLVLLFKTSNMEKYYKQAYDIMCGKYAVDGFTPVFSDIDGMQDKVYVGVTDTDTIYLNDTNEEVKKSVVINGQSQTLTLPLFSVTVVP
jgi:hypothetical protein